MNSPLVSVIIPAYNASKHIAETIRSVLEQEYTELELVIVNDGSTDNTEEIVRQFADQRIKYISQGNQGCSGAKNTGLNAAQGDFIQYLDADDLLSPDKISTQVKALAMETYGVAVCRTKGFYATTSEQGSKEIDSEFLYDTDDTLKFLLNLYGINGKPGMIQPNAFLISRELSDKAGPWDTTLSPAPDEDGEYFCRVILGANKILFTPGPFNFYRLHHKAEGSLSRQVSHLHAKGGLRSLQLISKHLLEKENSKAVKFVIAFGYSRFIYQYNRYKDLCNIAAREIADLGIKKIPVSGGKNFRTLATWIGFKNAIFLKQLFAKRTA